MCPLPGGCFFLYSPQCLPSILTFRWDLVIYFTRILKAIRGHFQHAPATTLRPHTLLLTCPHSQLRPVLSTCSLVSVPCHMFKDITSTVGFSLPYDHVFSVAWSISWAYKMLLFLLSWGEQIFQKFYFLSVTGSFFCVCEKQIFSAVYLLDICNLSHFLI